ncbi:MAG: methytransferase partner Trm112 [Dehalococcoidia bacterium]|nr:methytransferase partner Trm112 [Dehalococcoidia bacterium]
MKESIMEIIVCPVCKGPLELSVNESNNGDIVSGSLFCSKCNHSYSIQDGIPNLLPPNMNC